MTTASQCMNLIALPTSFMQGTIPRLESTDRQKEVSICGKGKELQADRSSSTFLVLERQMEMEMEMEMEIGEWRIGGLGLGMVDCGLWIVDCGLGIR